MSNTFTINGTDFVADSSKPLKAYICGVTPYNDSHCGHMRTYLAFDTMRKILKRYFGQDMFIVMNVTDIDDKIINKSHQEGVSFIDLARRYEKSFFEDMNALGVDQVTCVSRVTEYIDELIAFVQKIIDNGYAYESNGSVYFDTQAFMKKHSHNPFSLNLIEDDFDFEEESKYAHEKKDRRDVSLWKAQKYDYEPGWINPFSSTKGRPSWSCECAVMSTDILGDSLDIHFGGIDLKFPHHHNEILQVVAYYDRDPSTTYQWVKQFAHFGHLNISGLKMSKSLKNFITIKDVLKQYTPRQLRLLFLQHNWDQSLDYNEDNINHAISLEKTLIEFMAYMKYIIRKNKDNAALKWDHNDINFNDIITTTKKMIDQHLRANIDTKNAIYEIQKLITATYNYIKIDHLQLGLLMDVDYLMTDIFHCMGVDFESIVSSNNEDFNKVVDSLVSFRDSVRTSCMTINKKLSGDEGIQIALNAKTKLLEASDSVRSDLLNLNIKIEDRGTNPSIWKNVISSQII